MGVQLVHLLNQTTPVIIPSGLVPKGAYNNATDYSVGDSVDYNGSSYVMYVDAAAGTLPTDTTKWQVLANKGATGADGADGADGAQGIQGIQGVPGADGADGVVQSIVAGTNVTVDSTDPANPVVSASGGGGAWGDITGTLSDQTDLQSAIDAKATKSDAMIVCNHGSTASTARPTGAGSILWIGTVQPTNMTTGDMWVETI